MQTAELNHIVIKQTHILHITICIYFYIVKKDSKGIAVLLREGISFLWGIAKNYIMYWGVTSSIIAEPLLLVNTKLAQTLQI